MKRYKWMSGYCRTGKEFWVLSTISKVIERVVASCLLDHMTKNALIDPFQSDYRKGHSTETAPVRVHNGTIRAVEKGHGVRM